MKRPSGKIILATSVTLVAILGATGYRHFHDDPPPDISRFAAPSFDAPACARLKSLCDTFKSHFKEYKPVEPGDIDDGGPEENPSLEELALRRDPNALRCLRRHLAENKAALADAEALLSFGHYTTPPLSPNEPGGPRLDELSAIRNAAHLIQRQAILNAIEGREDEAWKSFRLIVSESPARHAGFDIRIITYLSNNRLDSLARNLAVDIASFDTDAARITGNAAELNKIIPQPDLFRRAISGEILFFSNCLTNLGRNGLAQNQAWKYLTGTTRHRWTNFWDSANFLPNFTLTTYIRWISPLIDDPDKPFTSEIEMPKSGIGWFFRRDRIGYVALGMFKVTTNLAQKEYGSSKAGDRLTRIALGLRVYQLSHDGKYPATPGPVTVGFTPEDLTDPFSGKPFCYDAVTGKVWSVGPNGKDDGGIGGDMAPRAEDDIVVAPPVLTPVPAKPAEKP